MARGRHKLAAPPRQTSQSNVQVELSCVSELARECLLSRWYLFVLLALSMLGVYGVSYRYGAVWNNWAWLCLGVVWGYFLVWGGWRQQRLKRRVWLNAYWHPHSRWLAYLGGGVAMWLWQLSKAVIMVPLLLIGPFLFTEWWQWLWLLGLTLFAPVVFNVWRGVLSAHVTPLLLPLLAWRTTWWVLTAFGVVTYLALAVHFTDASQYANLLDEFFQHSRTQWMASSWLFELYQWVSLKAALRWALGGQLGTLWANEGMLSFWRLLLHLPDVLWCGLWLKVMGQLAFLPAPRVVLQQTASRLAFSVMLLAVSVAAATVMHAQYHQPRLLLVNGQYYVMTRQQASLLEQKLQTFWRSQQQTLIQKTNTLIEQEVTQLFADARRRVPALVEHYYSLGAEYQRMLLAGAYLVGAAQEDTQAVAVWQRLMPELQNEAWFEALHARTQSLEDEWLMEALGQWYQELTQWLGKPLEDYMSPPAMAATVAPSSWRPRLEIAQQQFAVRQQISGFAFGAGVASGVGARVLLKRAGSKQLPSQLLKGLVTRVGGSALLCSPTGVGALGCAALGAGVWLTTDYAMLKLEQQQQGEQMRQSLLLMLKQQEHFMRKALLYDEALPKQAERIESRVNSE